MSNKFSQHLAKSDDWVKSGLFVVGDKVRVTDENGRYPQNGVVVAADQYYIQVKREDGTTIRKGQKEAIPI